MWHLGRTSRQSGIKDLILEEAGCRKKEAIVNVSIDLGKWPQLSAAFLSAEGEGNILGGIMY